MVLEEALAEVFAEVLTEHFLALHKPAPGIYTVISTYTGSFHA